MGLDKKTGASGGEDQQPTHLRSMMAAFHHAGIQALAEPNMRGGFTVTLPGEATDSVPDVPLYFQSDGSLFDYEVADLPEPE